MKKSFRGRIFRSIIALILLMVCSFGLLYIAGQRRALENNMRRNAGSLGSLLANSLRVGILTGNEDFIKEPVMGFLDHEDVLQIDVYDNDGRLLGSYGKGEYGAIASPEEAIREISSSSASLYRPGRYSEIWSPIYHSKSRLSLDEGLFPEPSGERSVIGYVRVSLSMDVIVKSTRELLTGTFLIAVAFILLGGTIAYYMARSATNPLRTLIGQIKGMEREGVKGVRIEGDMEIRELAEAFNSMAESLNKKEIEREKAEEYKREVERLFYRTQNLETIGRLSAGIAHDMNNILSIVLSNLNLIEMSPLEKTPDYVERINEAVFRGKEMANNLLNFSRGTSHNPRPLDLEPLVRSVVKFTEKRPAGNVSVNIEAAKGLWGIKGDPVQLQQILLNLYLNAMDAVESQAGAGYKGRDLGIRIKLDNITIPKEIALKEESIRHGDFVRLLVRDNGCGMDAETASRAFEYFFTTKGERGQGIGLAMARELVELNEGWIRVESEPGVGTTFSVYFPRLREGMSTEEAGVMEEVVGGSETVLLVEDEKAMADATKAILEHLGYNVVLCYSGEEALRTYENDPAAIDIVVSDLTMPGMSGIDLARRLKELDSDAVILITSGGVSIPEEIISLDEIAGFIGKPFRLNELSSKIRSALGYGSRENLLRRDINRVKFSYVKEATLPYREKALNPEAVYNLFSYLSFDPRENFLVLALDAQKNIIAYDNISRGSVGEAVVHPREVLRVALYTNAASILLVHNHTSGSLEPSDHDIVITATIVQACDLFGIEVEDHIIIGRDSYYSFKQDDLI